MGEEAKNGAGTLPAYKKITPEELDKYNIPATVQKYFGPRGLLRHQMGGNVCVAFTNNLLQGNR